MTANNVKTHVFLTNLVVYVKMFKMFHINKLILNTKLTYN